MTVGRWVRATFGGWLAGVPLVALFALAGEVVGLGGWQVFVGAGMGTAVGLLQGRALRGVFGRTAPWVWSVAIGLALPFLGLDVLRLTGHETRYAMQLAVAVGGVTVGVWQAFLLRAHSARAVWWAPASVAGWTVAALCVLLSDTVFRAHSIRGLAGAFLYLGLIALGGLVLSVLTGVALVWLLPPAAVAAVDA